MSICYWRHVIFYNFLYLYFILNRTFAKRRFFMRNKCARGLLMLKEAIYHIPMTKKDSEAPLMMEYMLEVGEEVNITRSSYELQISAL